MNLLIVASYYLTLLDHSDLYKYVQRCTCLPIRRWPLSMVVVLSACIAWNSRDHHQI